MMANSAFLSDPAPSHQLLSGSSFSKQISNRRLIASLVFQFAAACEFPYSSAESLGVVWALAAQMWPCWRKARQDVCLFAVSSWYKLGNLVIFSCLAWMSATCACVPLQCPWLSVQINAASWSSASNSFPAANMKLYWSSHFSGWVNIMKSIMNRQDHIALQNQK